MDIRNRFKGIKVQVYLFVEGRFGKQQSIKHTARQRIKTYIEKFNRKTVQVNRASESHLKGLATVGRFKKIRKEI